jgi:hypothetical protein
MKKIVIIFLFFPLYLFAQNNSSLPKIESITGDTISGKYNDIIINYDNLNRVKSMVNRNCFLPKTVSNSSGQLLVDTMQIQYFEYNDNQLQPFLRIVNNYEYDRIEYDNSNGNTEDLEYKAGRPELKLEWRDSVFHYYIYQNNQRVRDSLIYHKAACCEKGKIELTEKEVRIEQKNTSLEMRFVDKLIDKKYEEQYSKDSIIYSNNVRNVLSYKQYYSFHNSVTSVFSTFDNAVNPFHSLNIASILKEGKISFDEIDLNNLSNDFNLNDAIFQWYYLNENNPVVYEIKRGKIDPPYNDKMLLSYTYNDYKLPVSCNVQITRYFSNGELAGKYQKRFTFRYKGL